ncbi:hypothetical protein [Yinghuangia sp. YIM S09857]|uniref:hypothetical protein n=1 Tax=Yinghuangia sp. YIM S09857 TaxID=3436929 RepID=UPI003F5346B9
MTYATTAELRNFLRLGRPYVDDEEAEASLLLDLAGGVIEDATGQSLELATDTVVLDGPTRSDRERNGRNGSRRLLLPRWPVAAVASVTLLDDDQLLEFGRDRDYTWSASGILTRVGADWPDGDQVVEAVVTAGYTTIPNGIKRIELRLAAAGWGNPEGLTAESLGDHSKSYAAETLGMELSDADKKTLGLYRART